MIAPPTICIVDDDADVRDSLELLLRRSGFDILSFDSARAFLESKATSHIVCVLADVRMPEMDGLALQREITRRGPSLPVIIMTGHGDVQMAVQAMRAGAIDFLEKPFEKTALIEAIDRARQPINLAAGAGPNNASLIESLTEREREVFALLSEGQQNKVIARQLRISARTVEVHRARIMAKLNVKNLAELVKAALSQNRR